jgi:hypothetical protein
VTDSAISDGQDRRQHPAPSEAVRMPYWDALVLVCNQEVRGSSPLRSIVPTITLRSVPTTAMGDWSRVVSAVAGGARALLGGRWGRRGLRNQPLEARIAAERGPRRIRAQRPW